MTWETPSDRTVATQPRVRRCRGCGLLLTAGRRCACDSQTVHVITDVGPTDLPGLVVLAQLGLVTGVPRFSWGPYIAEWETAWPADSAPWPAPTRHTNNPCTVRPEGA